MGVTVRQRRVGAAAPVFAATGSRMPQTSARSGPSGGYPPNGPRISSSAVRRLFSTFAHGAPGAGLLLIRVVLGTTLVYSAVAALTQTGRLVADLAHWALGVLGLLLLVGLWTPIAGALVALNALWQACSDPSHAGQSLALGALGAALGLLGPGAWSIDARLFGWKRIEMSEKNSSDTPQPPSS